jgi:hypothetical protein
MIIPHTKENSFYVEFARWRCVVSANDAEEAATIAFEQVLDRYQSETEVSSIFTVLNLSKAMTKMSIEENVTFVYAPTVLSNAGMHDLSKDLQSIIENLKEKNK